MKKKHVLKKPQIQSKKRKAKRHGQKLEKRLLTEIAQEKARQKSLFEKLRGHLNGGLSEKEKQLIVLKALQKGIELNEAQKDYLRKPRKRFQEFVKELFSKLR